jgi:hypothetical protein
VGDRVRIKAWVRSVPGATKPLTVHATIGVYDADGNEVDFGDDSLPLTLTETWTALELETTIRTAGLFNTYISVEPSAAGDCFLVDDVVAWK